MLSVVKWEMLFNVFKRKNVNIILNMAIIYMPMDILII